MSKAKVLLVEDHLILRQGLKALFAPEPDIEVVGEAGTGRDALALAATLQPNVVLMDISMPDLNGIEATRQIQEQYPWIKVVILTMHANEEYIFQVLQAGAVGYVLKQADLVEVLLAIRAALIGGSFLSSQISHIVIDEYIHQARANHKSESPRLTPREREVLQLLAEGKPNRAIAAQLGVSVKTVESHRHNMMGKLKMANKTELVRYALRRGWATLNAG